MPKMMLSFFDKNYYRTDILLATVPISSQFTLFPKIIIFMMDGKYLLSIWLLNYNKFIQNMAEEIKAQIPIIDFKQLQNNEDISSLIKAAYGSSGHGILFVKGIDGYTEARREALLLINDVAKLPQETLKLYQVPQTYYSRGVSIGKEKFQGRQDNAKLSYYFNPVTDAGYKIPKDQENEFSQFQRDLYSKSTNVWPRQVPQLQSKIKALSKIMIQTGILLAKHIDKLAKQLMPNYTQGQLESTIKGGTFHFARMLHYFPQSKIKGEVDELCGWHNDHGALTALTSAMFIDEKGNIVESPPSSGGLYAKNRDNKEVRIKIPADMLAFQLGQSTQIYTGGKLEATPHAVKSPEDPLSKQLSRNTFAVFLQADPLGEMSVPKGIEPEKASVIPSENLSPLINRWTKNGMYFKDFHANTLKYYYPSA